jgi:hypothetical protein
MRVDVIENVCLTQQLVSMTMYEAVALRIIDFSRWSNPNHSTQ